MSFLKRIFNTKKVKKATEKIKDITEDVKDVAGDLAEKADKNLDISGKLEDVKDVASDLVGNAKEKIEEIDDKFEISDKIEDVKEKVSDIAEKAGDKIEAVLDDKISFDTFAKVEIKVGEITDAEEVKKSDKLLKLTVSFGDEDTRQIISGIKKSYSAKQIKGKKAIFVTNLEPRKIMGLESDGMILGVSEGDTFSILTPEKDEIKAGAKAS